MRGAFPALVFSGRRKSVVTPKKTQPIHLVWIGCVRFGRGAGVFQLERSALECNSGRHIPVCRVTSVPELVPLLRPALRVADMAPQAALQARLCRKDIAAAPAGRGVALCQISGACSKRTCPEQISAAFRIRRPRRVPAIRCRYFLRELQRPDGRTSCPSPRRASA